MKGYLLIFADKTRTGITYLHHKLFGRLCTVKNNTYYYPGLFEETPYTKLNHGCYFITDLASFKEIKEIPRINDKVRLYHIDIEEVSSSNLITARLYWDNYIKKNNILVRNL